MQRRVRSCYTCRALVGNPESSESSCPLSVPFRAVEKRRHNDDGLWRWLAGCELGCTRRKRTRGIECSVDGISSALGQLPKSRDADQRVVCAQKTTIHEQAKWRHSVNKGCGIRLCAARWALCGEIKEGRTTTWCMTGRQRRRGEEEISLFCWRKDQPPACSLYERQRQGGVAA